MDYGVSGENIVCFAGEDWWYHHPHLQNHLLMRLAQQNRVLFINSLSMGLPAVSNPDFFMKIRRKFKSYLRWLRKVPEGLYVMTPVNLPLYGSSWVRALNRELLKAQIHLAMCLCKMRDPILWVAIPSAIDVVECMKSRLVLYRVGDKFDANEDSVLSADVIRDWDRRMKQRAALVLYSGRKLYEESELPNRAYIGQGVDFDHFAQEAPETAADIVAIPRPVLGYFGAIDHVMDQELIAAVARRRPDWHWVLLGLKSNGIRISAPNVHFLGSKPYRELPKYVRHFDVCVLPWRSDSKFVQYGSAIKVREYLATGKPVVISPLYEYKNTPGVRMFHSPDEFIAVVGEVLANDTAAQRELRQSAVRDQTWDAVARHVGGLIDSLLCGGPGVAHAVTLPREPQVPGPERVTP